MTKHIKFDEDDEDELESQPPSTVTTLPICGQALMNKGTYVMKVDIRDADGLIAASTSTNVIKMYATAPNGHAVHLTDLSSHNRRITDMAFTNVSTLHSSCADGFIRGFDVSRTPGSNPTRLHYTRLHYTSSLPIARHRRRHSLIIECLH